MIKISPENSMNQPGNDELFRIVCSKISKPFEVYRLAVFGSKADSSTSISNINFPFGE